MTSDAVLGQVLRQVQAGIDQDFPGCRATLELSLEVVYGADGRVELRPSSGLGSPTGHTLTVQMEGQRVVASVKPVSGVATSQSEKMEGTGDSATLRRRLELVFGGPPGFTTGARAEILADLLREFGRPMLLESLQRDWVTQFDTGADQSASVSKG